MAKNPIHTDTKTNLWLILYSLSSSYRLHAVKRQNLQRTSIGGDFSGIRFYFVHSYINHKLMIELQRLSGCLVDAVGKGEIIAKRIIWEGFGGNEMNFRNCKENNWTFILHTYLLNNFRYKDQTETEDYIRSPKKSTVDKLSSFCFIVIWLTIYF